MVDSNPLPEPAQCPSYAAALGYMGVAAAVCLSNWGSAVGRLLAIADDVGRAGASFPLRRSDWRVVRWCPVRTRLA
jgi:hypothetical protein